MASAKTSTHPSEPNRVGPGEDPTPAVLAQPGTVIRRWTEPLATINPMTDRPHYITAPMPCHPRQRVVVPSEMIDEVAVCRVCSRTYQLTTFDEGDGGYAAEFTVAYRHFYLSDNRRHA